MLFSARCRLKWSVIPRLVPVMWCMSMSCRQGPNTVSGHHSPRPQCCMAHDIRASPVASEQWRNIHAGSASFIPRLWAWRAIDRRIRRWNHMSDKFLKGKVFSWSHGLLGLFSIHDRTRSQPLREGVTYVTSSHIHLWPCSAIDGKRTMDSVYVTIQYFQQKGFPMQSYMNRPFYLYDGNPYSW